MTRGRLPQHVYWRRRITLLAVVGILVLGVVSLIGHIGGGSPQRASTVSDVSAPRHPVSPHPQSSRSSRSAQSPPSSPADPSPSISPSLSPSSIASSSAPAVPSGPCAASDVVVAPSVASAVPDRAVTIRLAITSATTPACTFDLSPSTVQVVVQYDGEDVWNTADCRQAVPSETLVAQQATPAYVSISWGGHVGTDGCSVHNPWDVQRQDGHLTGLGKYTVEAAALGGTPSSSTFDMAVPVETAAPSPSAKPKAKRSTRPSTRPSTAPHAKPAEPHEKAAGPSASASAND